MGPGKFKPCRYRAHERGFFSGTVGEVENSIFAGRLRQPAVKVDPRMGILTSLLGGPFFLFKLIKHGQKFECM